MKRTFSYLMLVLTAGALALGFSGCGSLIPPAQPDPTRYYVLTGAPASTGPATTEVGDLRIGLRAIDIPLYLRSNKSVVVRRGLNELVFDEFSRWAESLEAGLSRVLKERLVATDQVQSVLGQPFPADVKRDYDLVVRVIQCEGGEGSNGGAVARFSAEYTLLSADDSNQILVKRTFVTPEAAWDGKNTSELVSLLSEGVAALTRDITANLPKK